MADGIVERGPTHDSQAVVGHTPDPHNLMVQEVEVRVQHHGVEVEVQAPWEAEGWVGAGAGAGALAGAGVHDIVLDTKRSIEVNWMAEVGALVGNNHPAQKLGKKNYNVLLPYFVWDFPLETSFGLYCWAAFFVVVT